MSIDFGGQVRRDRFNLQTNRKNNPYQVNHILGLGGGFGDKKQTQKSREDERLGENVGQLKKRFDAMYGSSLSGGNLSTEHRIRQQRDHNKNLNLAIGGSWWKDVLGTAASVAPFLLV